MIRKQRKAQWLYVCRVCDSTSPVTTDMFGAQENQQRHERSLGHGFKVLGQALQPIVDAYAEMGRAVITAAEPFAALYATPPNLPHDPALLRDRRKWGGR